jgi:hypothetical protein
LYLFWCSLYRLLHSSLRSGFFIFWLTL